MAAHRRHAVSEAPPLLPLKRKRGRPRKNWSVELGSNPPILSEVVGQGRGYWDRMTADERRKEMKKRWRTRRRTHRSGNGTAKARVQCPVCDQVIGVNNIHRHLTQTHHLTKAEARRALANEAITTRPAPTPLMEADTPTENHAEAISYIFGKVETLIEYYADSNGISRAALAEGVGALLHRHPRRQVLGAHNRVPYLR